MHCTRAGCSGAIEDGYCNVCGMAPEARFPVPVAAGTIPSAPAPPAGTVMSSISSRTGSARTGSRRTGSGRTRRGNLGAGIVDIPPIPARDPSTVVLARPEVAEGKRVCGRCGEPVGRSREGRPGRPTGFCAHCGQPFSFVPKLGAGDLVGGQYEVVGCIAHGGLGWIYLAKDRNVSDRWVVLKGLLDSGDADAMEAAIAERRFLAEMEHPNIVKIFNFVQHDGAGYIVMEYVGGETLKEIRTECRTQTGAPLPVARAIAYILEILPAFGYMHAKNLLYNDFKPENVKQTDEQMKLIDLGAVVQTDDDAASIYGTVGYQAPEVATVGASVASDLYTLARGLLVLTVDFKFQSTCATSLPVEDVPVFTRYESFHRFVVKGTNPDRDLRFQSAEEMHEQLLGVLHEVVAVDGAVGRPVPSKLFTPELAAHPDLADPRGLPVPTADPADPNTGLLASLAAASPDQVAVALEKATPSPEVGLRLTQAYIMEGHGDRARHVLDALAAEIGDDWRIAWWTGIQALGDRQWDRAIASFDGVYTAIPGELAPKLALACAYELAGTPGRAAPYYALVAATDPGSAYASFGLARTRLAGGDRDGAADALRRVPATSSAFARAQVMLCHVLSIDIDGNGPHLHDLQLASDTIAQLTTDVETRIALTRGLLESALTHLTEGVLTPDGNVHIAGVTLDERGVRRGLEKACRELSRYAPTRAEQIALIDQANRYRPVSLL